MHNIAAQSHREPKSSQMLAILAANIQYEWRILRGFARVSLDGRCAWWETMDMTSRGGPMRRATPEH